MILNKTSFLGGINQLSDITKLDPAEYWLIINGRVRKNAVEAVNLPLDISANLSGLGTFQELTAVGDKLVVFVAGKAYYKTLSAGNWVYISSFGMASTEARVYTELVPGSTVNYVRTVADANSPLQLGDTSTASQAALVVMDGVKRPWAIFPNGTSRVLGGYTTWTQQNPEYVPIATKPMFYNGVLYCVMKDLAGRETIVARSCTGAPFNFVIAVTPEGGKTSTKESEGGALALSTNVGYNSITAMATLNSLNGGFIVGSADSTFLVSPDLTTLYYAEPAFKTQFIASIGPLNQNSVVNMLGDAAFIHDSGMRSFNGIMQLSYEGRNAPFSGPINSLLDGITQTATAAGTFDNYALFALTTKYGQGILVYDMLLGVFVSLDLYPGIGTILKFTSALVGGIRYCYFLTASGVYELYGSSERATVSLYGAEVNPKDDFKSVKMMNFRVGFNNVIEGGSVEAVLFVNGQISNRKTASLTPLANATGTQISIPFRSPLTNGTFTSAEFNFTDASPEGYRVGVLLRFNTDGALVSASAEVSQGATWPRVNSLGSVTTIQPEKFIVIGNDGAATSARIALNTKLRNLSGSPKFIGVGNHAYPLGSLSDINTKLDPYWDNVKSRCLFVPGSAENSTDAGVNFFNYFAIPRYRVVETEFADLFMVNTGFDVAWAQTESANSGTLVSSAQFTWLRTALAASTKKHKWVVWNEAPYTSVDITDAGEVAALAELRTIPLKAWGATALLAGGRIILERLEVNGLLIIASGSGGGELLDELGTISPYSQFVNNTDYGYWEANVTELSVEFICKSTDGVILDRYYQSL
jgi:tartrate-resistant acid phosphatase type 5